jgi:deazaflavin-dependent oxidoreductase (nitroreductase family)
VSASPRWPAPPGRGPVRDLGRQRRIATHPNWYHNLKAHPQITVEVGTQTFTALAEGFDDTARAELSPKLVTESPDLGRHQAKTTRQIPVYG